MSNSFSINILTKDLVHGLGFAGGVIEKKPARQILGNVKLEAKDSNLYITGTSSDITVKLYIPAEVIKEGSTTVDILTFLEIVRKISDKSFCLAYNDETSEIEVKCENFVSHISTLPSSEFPSLDNEANYEGIFDIEAKLLFRLIKNSEFAISTEETRYNLNGIFFNCSQSGILNSTALDGHRLSTISEKKEDIPFFGVIIHKRTVSELHKLLKDNLYADSMVRVSYDSNRISFATQNIEISSKLVDATFPEYKSFLPEKSNNKLTIDPKSLIDVVDRVSTITQDKYRAIKLRITENSIEISAFGESKGNAREVINNDSGTQKFIYEGDPLDIGFNPSYLIDILKNCDESEIDILLNTSLDPIILKPITHEEDRYLIMPMKV
ncbi:MAG: DNA polymerase III subunit beta [Rickettsiaceae bacterium]|nr:DNA polymerase III subunit beta [Rickettsiaceae bacterium]